MRQNRWLLVGSLGRQTESLADRLAMGCGLPRCRLDDGRRGAVSLEGRSMPCLFLLLIFLANAIQLVVVGLVELLAGWFSSKHFGVFLCFSRMDSVKALSNGLNGTGFLREMKMSFSGRLRYEGVVMGKWRDK